MCDRVAVVAGGRLLGAGTVAEIAGAPQLVVRATPTGAAYDVVREVAAGASMDGDRLLLPVDDASAADVVERLVRAGIRVHEVSRLEPSLESAFMSMTAAGTPPAADVAAPATVRTEKEEVLTRGA